MNIDYCSVEDVIGKGGLINSAMEHAMCLSEIGNVSWLNPQVVDCIPLWKKDKLNSFFKDNNGDKDFFIIVANPTYLRVIDSYKINLSHIYKKKIAYVFWENYNISDIDKRYLEKNFDEIVVPASFIKTALKGINKKITVIPQPLDFNIYNPSVIPYCFKRFVNDCFIFFFIGGYSGRKGTDVMLNAYYQTFSNCDNVCLIIKANHITKDYINKEIFEIQNSLGKYNYPPVKIIFHSFYDQEKMASIYCGIDCGISLSRGEGMGMTNQEIMACGKPLIASLNTAMLDYINEFNSYPVASDTVSINNEKITWICPEYSDQEFFEPDIEKTKEQMYRAFLDKINNDNIGRNAYSYAYDNWRYEIIINKWREILQ